MNNSESATALQGPAPRSLSIQECERFRNHVDTRGANECWLWRKSKNPNGYGVFRCQRRNLAAHRVAHLIATGAWPSIVRHSCDVRACCNPGHLLSGTQQDNMDDKVRRLRCPTGERHPSAKLTWEKVRAIRADDRDGRALAKVHKVSDSLIWLIRANRIWRETGLCP